MGLNTVFFVLNVVLLIANSEVQLFDNVFFVRLVGFGGQCQRVEVEDIIYREIPFFNVFYHQVLVLLLSFHKRVDFLNHERPILAGSEDKMQVETDQNPRNRTLMQRNLIEMLMFHGQTLKRPQIHP